jgi:hypothetical protein
LRSHLALSAGEAETALQFLLPGFVYLNDIPNEAHRFFWIMALPFEFVELLRETTTPLGEKVEL